jgi:RecT family
MTTTVDEQGPVTTPPASEPPTAEEPSAPAEETNPGTDLARPVTASYDMVTRTLTVPGPVPGHWMEFPADQTQLDEKQMHLLAPLGIEAHWDIRAVAMFLQQCDARGFDPWKRHAFLLLIDGKYVNHTGILGLLGKAEETGEYRGLTRPEWAGPDGVFHHVWTDKHHPPSVAQIGVWRAGFHEPVYGVAMYDEYAPMTRDYEWVDDPSGAKKDGRPKRVKQFSDRKRPMARWRAAVDGGAPASQLMKCAKAIALRDAFPERCGGFYVAEETERAVHTERERRDMGDQETVGARRRAAFDEAMARTAAASTTTVAGPFPVFAGLGIPDDQARPLLLAELDEQATILGKTRREAVARWMEARGGQLPEEWGLRDLADRIRTLRKYVIAALRDQGRTAEADRYEVAPDVATVEDLFGRAATTVDSTSTPTHEVPTETNPDLSTPTAVCDLCDQQVADATPGDSRCTCSAGCEWAWCPKAGY